MNIWAIIAVFAALIFGGCIGFMIAYSIQCHKCSEKLDELFNEYMQNDLSRPNRVDDTIMSRNLANYLKTKYLDKDFDSECDDDDLYV